MLFRIKIVSFFTILSFFILILRLFYWQIYKGKELSIEARGQHQKQTLIDAKRGDILASDLSWFVASGKAWILYAEIPNLKEKPKNIAEKIAPFFIKEGERQELLDEIERIESLLKRSDVVWIPIKQRVDDVVKSNIEKLSIEGLGFEADEIRIYPEASSAAHLLGFVGKDEEGGDKGYFGLEGYYDVTLAGKQGYLSEEKDARGIPLLFGRFKKASAVKGVNLMTHLDKFVQVNLEQKLKEGIEKYGAEGGIAIVMNPKNGAVLGMSSYPTYDPRNYWEFGDNYFSNPAISSTFEPGSIFKVLVMASALDAKAIEPDTVCDICSGPARVDKYSIETWNNQYYPGSEMTDIIVHSDNVGMVFVGQKLGSEKLYDYLAGFGIGTPTEIDLQGEANITLRERGKWSVVDLATASFGQGVAVTPIQMITAVSVIANKGVRVNPEVVDRIMGEGWEEDIKPKEGKRVISEEASEEITAMMVEAARSGEAKWTYKKGFRVAGKTGTAQIPIEGHYDEEKTIASFIGFAPYNDPKFVMLVTLRKPTSSPWASETAAPLWYSIASGLFLRFGIQPEN